MKIANSTLSDLPEIFRLYRLATAFQKERFPRVHWPEFEEEMVIREIAENKQFKILINNQIACIWATTFSDPVIWKNDDGHSAIYIHRIATNPDFRGNNFVKMIVSWAREYASDKKYIRMDTCGNNTKLIQYYSDCGFSFLGIKKLENAAGLPAHYQHADVCYFEIKLD